MNRPGEASPDPGDLLKVVPADRRHLSGIVQCHLAAFPGQFLTRLGPRFLEAYYRFYMDSPGGINLVAVVGDRVLGFVSGGDPAVRGRFIRSRVPRFIGLLAWHGLWDPFVRRRLAVHLTNLVRTLAGRLPWSRQGSNGTAKGDDASGVSVLLSIAVDPTATGRGIGRRLMEAFREESLRRGYREMTLSAHSDNDSAIRLYRACGWEVVRQEDDGVYLRRRTDP